MQTKELTNFLLKEKMEDAMVIRGMVSDLDSLVKPGIYSTTPETACANPPDSLSFYWKYAAVEVFVRNSRVFQRLTCMAGCVMRTFSATETPGNWTTLATFM